MKGALFLLSVGAAAAAPMDHFVARLRAPIPTGWPIPPPHTTNDHTTVPDDWARRFQAQGRTFANLEDVVHAGESRGWQTPGKEYVPRKLREPGEPDQMFFKGSSEDLASTPITRHGETVITPITDGMELPSLAKRQRDRGIPPLRADGLDERPGKHEGKKK